MAQFDWAKLFRLVLLWIVFGILCMALSVVVRDSPLLVDPIRFMRGYPYTPGVLFPLVVISVVALLKLRFGNQVKRLIKTLPGGQIANLARTLLAVVDATTLSKLSWAVVLVSSTACVVVLMLFPHCLTSSEVLLTFSVQKGNSELSAPAPVETVSVRRGETILLKASLQPTSPDVRLPAFEYTWTDGGIGSDARLRHKDGPTVDYLTGTDDTADPVSLRVTQSRCKPLGDFPLFFAPVPK